MILQALRACFRAPKRVEPVSAARWNDLARGFKLEGKTAEAVQAYEKAMQVEPQDPAAYVNLAFICLTQLGDAARAESLLRRAVALAPQSIEAQTNLGLALHDQGRWSEALAHFEKLAENVPECVEYRWHRACARLGAGDFVRGWEDYEARKQRTAGWRAPPPLPEWQGEPVEDGALLVYAEQGVGDEIMFASCIPDAAARAPQCVIECDERIAGLFRRSFPRGQVHAVDRKSSDLAWLTAYPRLCVQCAIGSLPRLFRRSREKFPGTRYLHADAARVDAWRRRLASSDGKLNIGIAWRGGTYQTRRELRSTTLRDWLPVLATPSARFYALQTPTDDELASAQLTPGGLEKLEDVDRDFDELAAAVSALDLVITVQGTLAHLAGALGCPVWVLLSSSAEWRYLDEGAHMPWYGSARLFRQPAPRAWEPVFSAVAEALRA